MPKEPLRAALSTGAVLAVLVAACAPGCGGSSTKAVPFEQEAGASGESEVSGAPGASGRGGTAQGGSSGAVPTTSDAGAAGEAGFGGTPVGAGGVLGQAGVGHEQAGAGGTPSEPAPDIDAGADCIAPSAEPELSAASAGLPASGLSLWLRGDRGVYMTADQRVCAWADQSGHERGLVANADSNRPLWQATGIGGRPAVHFDAPSRYLVVSGVLDIAPTSARTMITVVQLVNTSGRFSPLMQGQGNSPGTYLMVDTNTYNTAGNREGVYLMNNSYDSALATSTTPRIHIYTIDTMTPGTPILGAIEYRVNGAIQTLTRNYGGLGNGNFEDFSGANYTAVGSGPDAFVAEALFYDRALSTAERTSVETALEARYGIVSGVED